MTASGFRETLSETTLWIPTMTEPAAVDMRPYGRRTEPTIRKDMEIRTVISAMDQGDAVPATAQDSCITVSLPDQANVQTVCLKTCVVLGNAALAGELDQYIA